MKYGLALSGGGTRGAAHVGVLKALAEENLLPEAVAGTSAGGIVAGLYASGMEIEQMETMVNYLSEHGREYLDPDYTGLLEFIPQLLRGKSVNLSGLIKGDRLLRYFCGLTKGKKMKEAVVKTVIPAVDLNSGDTIVYTNSDKIRWLENIRWERDIYLCEAMIASSSVPAIFAPRKLGNYCLVDGGVTDNLPENLLEAAGERRIVAVDIGADYRKPQDDSILEVVSHSFSIMSMRLKECGSTSEILLLKPKLSEEAGLLTFDRMKECMVEGYRYTKQMAPELRRRLSLAYQPDIGNN